MKLGWSNFLDDATISASSVDTSYPISNVTHRFLEKKYQSEDGETSTVITIEFDEEKTISMLAYGYSNIEGNEYNGDIQLFKDATDGIQLSKDATDGVQMEKADNITFLDSSGDFLERVALTTGEDFNFTYFDDIACNSVVLSVSSSDTIYLGGLCVTSPLEFEHIQINPQLPFADRGDPSKTDDGQLLPDEMPILRKWTVVIPYSVATNTMRRTILSMYKTIGGASGTMWADLWDGDTAAGEITEDPMYCNLVINSCRLSSTGRAYNIGMTFEECR